MSLKLCQYSLENLFQYLIIFHFNKIVSNLQSVTFEFEKLVFGTFNGLISLECTLNCANTLSRCWSIWPGQNSFWLRRVAFKNVSFILKSLSISLQILSLVLILPHSAYFSSLEVGIDKTLQICYFCS